jgi:ABC-type sugar transport system substrate-binding protein
MVLEEDTVTAGLSRIRLTTALSALAVVGSLFAVSAGAVAQESSPPAGDPTALAGKKITYVSVLKGHPVIQLWIQGMRDGAAMWGAELEELVAEGYDVPASIAMAEQVLATTGTDAMVVTCFDPSYKPLVQKASEMGVPVVCTHYPPLEGEYPGNMASIGFSTEIEGRATALHMGEKLGGKGTVIVTVGSFNETENGIANAFASVMRANYPDIVVLPTEEEGFDVPSSVAKTAAILQANPELVAASSTTGGGGTAWAGGAAETGRDDLVIYTTDYTRENLDLLTSGRIYAIIAEPAYEEHVGAVELVKKILLGEPYDFLNIMPTPIVTAEDEDLVAHYMDIAVRSEE